MESRTAIVSDTNFDSDKSIAACLMPLIMFWAALLLVGCTTHPDQRSASEATLSFELDVQTAEGRLVPLTIVAPNTPGNYPLIAFSHGAFAAPNRYRALLTRYAEAGFVIIAPLHIDSELMEGRQADRSVTWSTRGEDFEIAYDPPTPIVQHLREHGIILDRGRIAAMGHSYGALIAQVAAGVEPNNSAGNAQSGRLAQVRAVISWSPPGPVPDRVNPDGWAGLEVPSFTQTGTADILPGFIDDWRVHRYSYDNAPGSGHYLWIGEGVDHYFGGIYGRETVANAESQRLFDRAVLASIGFLDEAFDAQHPRSIGEPVSGETLERK